MAKYFLVAGIDFGTSYSKVVLREQGTKQAVVVTFEKHDDGLLSSLVGIDGENLIPPASLDDFACVPYLKMLAAHVADGAALDTGPVRVPGALNPIRKYGDGKIIRDLLAFYFANVMAATELFIKTKSPWRHFDGYRDQLIYQLAIPTGLLDNDGTTEKLFRKSFISAYELRHKIDARMIKPLPYQAWAREVEKIARVGLDELRTRHKWQCLDYPEVLAAMQTVFRSPNPQQDGRYITMDVGAGTVELNAFYRNTGEHLSEEARLNTLPTHDYYAMSVCPLGIHHLKDPHELVSPRKIADLENAVKVEVASLFHRALVYQPNLGHHGHRTWDRARFMIFGGGATLPPYRGSFNEALQNVGIFTPQILDLPAASDLEKPSGVAFGRFAVAYGMSFFRPNLDNWRPPNQIFPFNHLYPKDGAPPAELGFNWED